MIPRPITRAIAFVLIICLVIDPVTAANLSPLNNQKHFFSLNLGTRFEEEGFAPRILQMHPSSAPLLTALDYRLFGQSQRVAENPNKANLQSIRTRHGRSLETI